jgi:hypothetical protein
MIPRADRRPAQRLWPRWGFAPDRARAFFESLYELHIAAIRPKAEPAPTAVPAPLPQPAPPAPPAPIVNVHDYVSEMAVGTWLAFSKEGRAINARLTWVSPLRTKYLFTSRSRARAFVYTPEELAYELGGGKVTLVVETGAAVRSGRQRGARHARCAATFGNARPRLTHLPLRRAP